MRGGGRTFKSTDAASCVELIRETGGGGKGEHAPPPCEQVAPEPLFIQTEPLRAGVWSIGRCLSGFEAAVPPSKSDTSPGRGVKNATWHRSVTAALPPSPIIPGLHTHTPEDH